MKFKKYNITNNIIFLLLVITAIGCGGGGNDDNPPSSMPTPDVDNIIDDPENFDTLDADNTIAKNGVLNKFYCYNPETGRNSGRVLSQYDVFDY